MRDYHNIFKGINVSNNGTVSIQEFEKHMARVAPELLPNAQRMYNAACKKGASKGKCDSELDFQSLLSVLFPSATKRDVKELVQMTINRKPNKQAGPTAEQLHDAGTVFKFWNKTGDGLLTYQEMENGLEGLRMTEEDVDEWLEDVFGRDGGPDARNCVNLAEFTAWFTSHPGGKLCRL
jgi:Ca2+-binding EF-hand superfamily protein